MKPFASMIHGPGSESYDSAPNWFLANASGPCTVLVYDGPRAPRAWLIGFMGRMTSYCHSIMQPTAR